MSAISKKLFFVVGATGTQGGATAKELIKAGHNVRFLTRNPSSDNANKLIALGAEAVVGELGNKSFLDNVLKGVIGIFSIPPLDGSMIDHQEEYAKNLADSAKTNGVQSFIHTSAPQTEEYDDENAPESMRSYRKNKWAAEEVIRAADFDSWTIFRPTWIMENFSVPKSEYMYPDLKNRKIVTVLQPDLPIDLIAAVDIGRFAVTAFENPVKFHQKEIILAGDRLTNRQIVEILSRVKGKKIELISLSLEKALETGFSNDLAANHNYLNKIGFSETNLEQIHSYGISLTSFEQWAADNKDEIIISI
ncbi:MAG: NmrA/HSCARG family protein [Planctomycetaceae bacterium]|jgi:uncharacterized protein YbjT (DUF2867 family)|nr:NmrA/HSCARG family protein [Planctomycetaceae bacterium]